MELHEPEPEALAEALYEAPIGFVLCSPEALVLRANPAYCALVGVDEASLVGLPVTILTAADQDHHLQQLRDAMAPGGPIAHVARRVLRRSDGALVEVQYHCRIVRDREGRARYAMGFVTDVTGEARAARTHQDTVATLERAFETAPFGLAVIDPSMRFRQVNVALATMFGRPAEELVGIAYVDLLHPEERARAEAWPRDATQGALKSRHVERRFVDGRGRTIHLSTGGTRVTVQGEDLYYGLFIDVTERRLAEAERAELQEQVLHAERLRTLGQIAGGIAHEVNNPAAITVGGVDLARRHMAAITTAAKNGDLAAVRRYVERLEASLRYCEDGSARLAKVARKLGAFSTLHGGDIERVDVNVLVQRALELVQNDVRHRATLHVELGELPPLQAHASRLILALTNLILNAAQAVDGLPADQRISVSTSHGHGEIVIVVTDTGAGIPGGLVDHIFEPFFTTRGPTEGSGLGLTVVNDVVRQHRGRIEVGNEPGGGSRFAVYLPLLNGLGPAVVPPPPALTRARILVVDDEPLILAILSEILESDHDVVTSPGGPEALQMLARDTAFDALLCDLMMPGVDGIAIHRYLLENAPALAARTVFSTGGAFTARAEGYVTSLGRPVLLKPFTVDEVRAMVSVAIAGAPTNDPDEPTGRR